MSSRIKKKPLAASTAPQAMLMVGPSAEAIREVKIAILEILSLPTCGDEPKAEAMVTLRKGIQVQNVVIRDCVFNGRKR